MRTITLEQFHEELKAQEVGSREHLAFVCVACGTVQSGQDFINAGAGKTFEDVEKYVGFSCVGRFTNAGPPQKGSGKSCNWSLGGLFRIHQLEIVTEDGEKHPRFELATPEQAQAQKAKNSTKGEK
jgi:hypothetical protein